jgi:hypothetical protein
MIEAEIFVDKTISKSNKDHGRECQERDEQGFRTD